MDGHKPNPKPKSSLDFGQFNLASLGSKLYIPVPPPRTPELEQLEVSCLASW